MKIIPVILFFAMLGMIACNNSQSVVAETPKKTDNSDSPNKNSEVVVEGCKESVAVMKGQRLVLKLPATAGTGYTWQIATPARNLAQTNAGKEGFVPINKEDSEKVGYPSWQVFEFSTTDAGDSELVLNYVRPWEAKNVAQTCKIRVQVK